MTTFNRHCPAEGGRMSNQERLAEMLRKLARSDYFKPEEFAAAILDSDVIREIKAEAWEDCAAEYEDRMTATQHFEVPNPYLPTCHPRGVEK